MNITCRNCGCFLELNRIYVKTICRLCENEYRRTYNLTAPYRLRQKSRSLANKALRRGKLIRKPCEKCGNAKSEMHHEDYDKPLQVTWLCRPCHLDLHTLKKAKELEMESKDIAA